MLLVSLLGSAEFYLAIIPLILWCYDRALGLRLLLLCSVSAAVNAMLQAPLPCARHVPTGVSEEVKAFASEPSFGMPSAAAQVSVTFLGYTGPLVWEDPGRGCLYHHYSPCRDCTDVPRLYIFSWTSSPVGSCWSYPPFPVPALRECGCSVVPAKAALLCDFSCVVRIRGVHPDILVRDTWSWHMAGACSMVRTGIGTDECPHQPRDPERHPSRCGAPVRAAAGAAISAEYIPYRIDGNLSLKALRFFAGGLVLAVLWTALSAYTKSPDIAGYSMTWFRAALAGLWITPGAPLLFEKNRLVP